MHSYPSIYNLGHKAVADIFLDPVIVQEKIDGSQFSFGLYADHGYKARSRKMDIDLDNPAKQFAVAVEYTRTLPLLTNRTYRAEVVEHANVLKYQRQPRGSLILFDVNDYGEEFYLLPEVVAVEARRLGLECVNTFYYGPVPNYMALKAFLDRESILGGPIEGIVIKNYNRFGVDKHPLFAKWVRAEYKEAHKREWAPGPSVIEQIVATLRHERRWEKAIEHLRDEGRLQEAVQDIGPLMKEVQADILKEEVDWIKDKLFENAKKNILRGITAGLPEWYKDKLVRSQFDAHTSNS